MKVCLRGKKGGNFFFTEGGRHTIKYSVFNSGCYPMQFLQYVRIHMQLQRLIAYNNYHIINSSLITQIISERCLTLSSNTCNHSWAAELLCVCVICTVKAFGGVVVLLQPAKLPLCHPRKVWSWTTGPVRLSPWPSPDPLCGAEFLGCLQDQVT